MIEWFFTYCYLLFLRIMIFCCSIKCPEWLNWRLFHQLRFINFSLRISNAIKISGSRALVLAMQNRFIMYQIVPYIFLPLSHLEKNLHLFFKSQVGSHVCYMYPIICVLFCLVVFVTLNVVTLLLESHEWSSIWG